MAPAGLHERLRAQPGEIERFAAIYTTAARVTDIALAFDCSSDAVYRLGNTLRLHRPKHTSRSVKGSIDGQIAAIARSPGRRKAFEDAYRSGQPIDSMAGSLGITRSTVRKIAAALDLPPRRRKPRRRIGKPKARARPCLCCGKTFDSAGAHNRLCGRCGAAASGLPAQYCG